MSCKSKMMPSFLSCHFCVNYRWNMPNKIKYSQLRLYLRNMSAMHHHQVGPTILCWLNPDSFFIGFRLTLTLHHIHLNEESLPFQLIFIVTEREKQRKKERGEKNLAKICLVIGQYEASDGAHFLTL